MSSDLVKNMEIAALIAKAEADKTVIEANKVIDKANLAINNDKKVIEAKFKSMIEESNKKAQERIVQDFSEQEKPSSSNENDYSELKQYTPLQLANKYKKEELKVIARKLGVLCEGCNKTELVISTDILKKISVL